MKPIRYREHVDASTAMMLSIPETAHKYDVSEWTVRKLAKECGAMVKIGSTARILQKEFEEHVRTYAVG